ncbi:MAG TPA: AI-2E family transporter, partial [Holophaga sp.]|nr:AI-2E family transporter [Holophaga sp.]
MARRRFRIPVTAALVGAGLLVAVWMLRKALAPFFLAMVLAYLLAPAVARLSRWVRRSLAVVLVILAAFAVLLLAADVVVPRLVDQVDRLIGSLPTWKTALEARWTPWFAAHPWAADRIRQGLEGLDPMALLLGLWGAGAD